MGRLAIGLALPAHRLLFHHWHSSSVHLHIQDRNRLTDDDRQIQLHGPLDLPLLVCCDVFSDRFRRPLHSFGCHLQTSKEFHLLTAVVEGRLLAHRRLHAAHPRRDFRVLDIQFGISGELARMAMGAQVIGARHFRLTYRSEDRLGAQLPITGLVVTGRDFPLRSEPIFRD